MYIHAPLQYLNHMNHLTWYVTVVTAYKLKAYGNVWYYQACHKCPKVAKGSSPLIYALIIIQQKLKY